MEELLMALLECGSLDLHMLDGVEYDLGEIVYDLRNDGLKPTLNQITAEIFLRGQRELIDAFEAAIAKRKDEQIETDDSDEGQAEFDRLQSEIDELEMLDPDVDMDWFCNCLDTSCWLNNHEDIYRKYLGDDLREIEDHMGFEF